MLSYGFLFFFNTFIHINLKVNRIFSSSNRPFPLPTQHRFDSETAKLIDEIKLDRQLKDKLLKERDDLMADKITLNQTVKVFMGPISYLFFKLLLIYFNLKVIFFNFYKEITRVR